jgi:hypothetical protein
MDQDPFYEFGGKGWGNANPLGVLKPMCCLSKSRRESLFHEGSYFTDLLVKVPSLGLGLVLEMLLERRR